MAAADQPPQLQPRGGGRKDCMAITLIFAAVLVVIVALALGIGFLSAYQDREFPVTVFTVAITGVTGLDPAVLRQVVDTPTSPPADDDYSSSPPPRTLISPVFNLTFQIDNTGNLIHDACVPGISRVDVSYGDDAFFLAGGSVPPFCAGELRTSGPVAATAWGENVAVPRFVRDQLAMGDAAVDVKVTMPTYCRYGRCDGNVLSCKPKIGGGTSPACRLDRPPSFCELFDFCY